uniref:Uncharacterized protein n=1 Tax=Siphoviridae sp. ctKy93 TaxID=2827569 RepID=A0A8S5RRQ4_9CAUD|nr:MAG TPA: hypothetical protein [Siphoviridae sp. ctKy93]
MKGKFITITLISLFIGIMALIGGLLALFIVKVLLRVRLSLALTLLVK